MPQRILCNPLLPFVHRQHHAGAAVEIVVHNLLVQPGEHLPVGVGGKTYRQRAALHPEQRVIGALNPGIAAPGRVQRADQMDGAIVRRIAFRHQKGVHGLAVDRRRQLQQQRRPGLHGCRRVAGRHLVQQQPPRLFTRRCGRQQPRCAVDQQFAVSRIDFSARFANKQRARVPLGRGRRRKPHGEPRRLHTQQTKRGADGQKQNPASSFHLQHPFFSI